MLTKRGFPGRPSLGFLQYNAETLGLQLDIHHLRGFAACGVNAKKRRGKALKKAAKTKPCLAEQKKLW